MHRLIVCSLVLAFVGCSVNQDTGPSEPPRVQRTPRVASDAGACHGMPCSPPETRRIPRPIAPLSAMLVTTRRPTLRWSLADVDEEAAVDLCRDRACTSVIESFAVSGDHAKIGNPLSPGVVFWRLRSSSTSEVGPTWEFVVGPQTDTDTAFTPMFDPNGDGFADAGITARVGGRLFLFLGSSSGLGSTPAVTIDLSSIGIVGPVANAGDVNGDGFADALVAAGDQLLVFLGTASGLEGPAPQSIPISFDVARQRHSFDGIGDFDGDGYGDIVVSAPSSARAFVYFGSPAGVEPSTPLSLAVPAATVGGAGDVDGDGLGDVILGAPDAANGVGRAFLVPGNRNRQAQVIPIAAPETATRAFGADVASAGDVDGDGLADVVIGAPSTPNAAPFGPGRAYVFRGQQGTHLCSTALVVPSPFLGSTRFGIGVGGGKDLTGDFYSDFVVSALTPTPEAGDVGAIAIYTGSADPSFTTPALLVRDEFAGGQYAASFASPGDVDGDGFSDLLVGAPTSPTRLGGSMFGPGLVYLYAGATVLSSTPRLTLSGDTFGVREFGFGVD